MADKSRMSQEKEQQVEAILDEARPFLESHGGGIRLLNITDEGIVRVSLHGHCVGCSLSTITLRLGVEKLLMTRLPEIVKGLQEV